VIAQQRKQTLQRIGLAMCAIVVAALVWWGFTTF
jgi:hypothetical protein